VSAAKKPRWLPGKLGRRLEPSEEPEPHRCPAAEKTDKLTALLLGLQGTGHQQADITALLDILDPGHEKREARHPLADPLTGAMPVDPEAYRKKNG
jgi:hypothetical protein